MTRTICSLACLATCLIAGTGWADTRVRAGEHATFTRLVLYLPGPVGSWTATGAEEGYAIDITPAPSALDTSDVFAFIPRTRIADVALRDGKVRIVSACDCHISVFRARPDVVAIDVRDGPDPSQPEMPPRPADPAPAAVLPTLLDLRSGDPRTKWQVGSRIEFAPPPEPIPQRIESNALATAVARAASGGVLSANTGVPGLDRPGIETRSALDSARSDHAKRLQTALCGHIAQLDDLSDMSAADAWRVIDNTTESAIPAQRGLAYLALGFGAEAALDFTDSQFPPDQAILLAQIARFIDAPDRSAPRGVRSAGPCGGVAALLAVLATPPSERIADSLGLEAVTTLSRLPFPLRAHLAVHLEARLMAAGLPELAQSANFARLRATATPGALDQAAATRAPRGAGPTDPYGRTSLPPTPFFEADTSAPIYDAIAAGRFAAEDRILIEAWIKEAPSIAEADAASAFYVAALNNAARPLNALAHLDARFGRRGIVPPGLDTAISDTLATAADVLGPAELLVLGARLPHRPWFDRLPASTRLRFEETVSSVRMAVTGAADLPQSAPLQGQPASGTEIAAARQPVPDLFIGAADSGSATVSPRRLAAEAAIASATDSLSRSARLRAEATESIADWARPPR